jgi:hypothetical protein
VEKLGSHGTYGDLYFAFGLPGAELEPVKVAESLGLNATHAIRLQGLNDSTTYAYAYYLANDAGERQPVITGSFKTAYVQPVELSVTRSYFTRNAVGFLYEITSLGEGGTSADLYAACLGSRLYAVAGGVDHALEEVFVDAHRHLSGINDTTEVLVLGTSVCIGDYDII